MYRKPKSYAPWKAFREFSGKSNTPPLWANASGKSDCKKSLSSTQERYHIKVKFFEISNSQHGLMMDSIAYKYGKTYEDNRNYWASK